MTATTSSLLRLPDELLEAIALELPGANDTVQFSRTCKHVYKVTCAPQLWRRYCVTTWRYWEERHNLAAKLELPPRQSDWYQLYNERARIDREALGLFNEMLSTQQSRIHRMGQVAAHRYDVKDLLLRLKDETPDSAEDVLARRYYADAILGRMYRSIAIEKWMRLQQGHSVRLEEALGAFDLFLLPKGAGGGIVGDLGDISREFDRLAQCVKDQFKNENKTSGADFNQLAVRERAVRVAQFLRSKDLVGKPDTIGYHALWNNFISLALFGRVHSSLPLQSVAIYCAVAERLGVDARPSNFPQHVHAVIQGPPGETLDGEPQASSSAPIDTMYMDPWNSSDEVPHDRLRQFLHHVGIPASEHAHHLEPSNVFEMVLRTSRNMHAALVQPQQALNLILGNNQLVSSDPSLDAKLDHDLARYAMFWAQLVLGDADPATAPFTRRRRLGHVLDYIGARFPEDIALFGEGGGAAGAVFESGPERRAIDEMVESAYTRDQTPKTPKPRTPDTETTAVRYRVGQCFRHRQYGYLGFVTGWDRRCNASPQWIDQMGVRDLPGGAEQPFYHVIANDKSARYVAQENIHVPDEFLAEGRSLEKIAGPDLMRLAGRYFKRCDDEKMMFVSNIQDEYPDD